MKTAATPTIDQVKAEILRSLPSGRAIVDNWDKVGSGVEAAARPDPSDRIVFCETEDEVKAAICKSIPSAAAVLANWDRVKPGA